MGHIKEGYWITHSCNQDDGEAVSLDQKLVDEKANKIGRNKEILVLRWCIFIKLRGRHKVLAVQKWTIASMNSCKMNPWRKITVHFCNNLLQGISSDSCNITLSLYLKYGTIVILNNCLFEKHSQAFWILLNWGGKRQKGISCMLEAGRKCIKDMRGKIRETKERVLNSIIFLYWYCYPVESYYMWRWPKRKIQGCRI